MLNEEIDPVSGNEIPPGGTAEGVRDDIDAKLSEGEYVIPANVVMFLGIDKIQKMVDKAKEQLGAMEEGGDAGGGPTEGNPETDDLPFSTEELSTEEAPVEMAAGGPVFNPAGAGGVTGIETRYYVDGKGGRRPIVFYNGRPITMVPPGYMPEGALPKQETPETTVKPVSQKDESNQRLQETDDTPTADVANWTTDDFEKLVKQQGTVELLSKGLGLGGPGGMLIGTAMSKGNEYTISKATEEIMNRIQNPEIAQDERERLQKVFEQLESKQQSKGAGIFGGLMGEEGLLGGLLPEGGLLGMFTSSRAKKTEPGAARSLGGTGATAATGMSSSNTSRGGAERTSSAPTVSPRPASRPTRQTSTPTSSNVGGGNVSQDVRDKNAAAGGYTGGGRYGGFSKGGLVTRRKK